MIFAAALPVAMASRRRCCCAPSAPPCMDSRSGKILVALVVVCVVVGGAYVAVAALGPNETTTDAQPAGDRGAGPHRGDGARGRPLEPALNGRVFVVDDGKVQQEPGDLACERVYYAAGHGICMGVAPSGVDYTASRLRLEPAARAPHWRPRSPWSRRSGPPDHRRPRPRARRGWADAVTVPRARRR